MTTRLISAALTALLGLTMTAHAADTRVYELRHYAAAPGRFDAMNELIEKHGVPAFDRHGIRLEAAMVPVKNDSGTLVVLYSFPSEEARQAAWQAFRADPAWVAAKDASQGAVAKFDSAVMVPTDYSPTLTKLDAQPGRVFELRTYTATPNNLTLLNARFRDHTVKLFEKYGMTNVIYFNLEPTQPKADRMLIYFLAHAGDDARQKSFDAFRQDPDWLSARKASEVAGKGSLTEAKDGVLSEVLTALPWSPLK